VATAALGSRCISLPRRDSVSLGILAFLAGGRESLLEWLREERAGSERPRSIEFLERLPRELAGKLLERTLRDSHWRGHETRVP